MPKKQPPKNSTWVQLTKDFVSEWPEVMEGLQFQNMPVKYLKFVNIILKNNITINYNIEKELKKMERGIVATPKSREYLESFAEANQGSMDILLMQMGINFGYKMALENVKLELMEKYITNTNNN